MEKNMETPMETSSTRTGHMHVSLFASLALQCCTSEEATQKATRRLLTYLFFFMKRRHGAGAIRAIISQWRFV